MAGKQTGQGSAPGRAKPKMTKEERRAKYTEIARKRRQKQYERERGFRGKSTVCYNCRQSGHTIANCPLKNDQGGRGGTEESNVLCYKCGSTEHGLHQCPKRNKGGGDELPFATCFVCKEKGHLASGCPQNKKGIYVNGGNCRHCGSVEHLATACPEKKKNKKSNQKEDSSDVEDLLEQPRQDKKSLRKDKTKKGDAPKKKRRVVKF